jgi:hypothetical protein
MMNRTSFRLMLLMAGLVMIGSLVGGNRLSAQSAGTQSTTAKVLPAAAADPGAGAGGSGPSAVGGHTGNPTQLQLQTEKLAAMAAELKARVDKTNKDVLSLSVVQQAQAIEQYAHQLKQGDPKH